MPPPSAGSRPFILPPHLRDSTGAERKVGVEIEFAGLSAEDAAWIVRHRFGGQVEESDPHRFKVVGTRHGDYTVELDARPAHPRQFPALDNPFLNDMRDWFERSASEAVGHLISSLVPCEIVTPPIPMTALHELCGLVEALQHEEAMGTDENMAYAFGVHFNPQIVSRAPDYLLSVLRAYLLLEEVLRARHGADLTRRFLPFSDPFPKAYAKLALEPAYAPDIVQLIDDYLVFNNTRNRGLDMLPIFGLIDRDKVRAAVRDGKVSVRPTFHYRIPDARLNDPEWSLERVWTGWVAVEELADRPDLLAEMGRAFIDNFDRLLPADWSEEVSRWFDLDDL